MDRGAPKIGRTVEKEVFIRASAERVFRALVDKADLERWFVTRAVVDARPGGALHFTWNPDETVNGEFRTIEPPNRLVYLWDEGPNGSDAYRKWIRSFADGLRGRQAIVVLEPDALAGMDCLNASGQQQRIALLRDAVQVLSAQRASVYVDAGHARWKSAEQMAGLLRQVDVASAAGFSLNVSNYIDNAANIAFGERVSRLLGGKHFIIDTSRNGLGSTKEWCNARGQALGIAPTTKTGHPLVDAFLWIKQPGESDGSCQGGPKAGAWWTDIALELSRAASTLAKTIAK